MNTNILIPSKAAWRPQPSTGEQTIDGVCPRFDQITPQFRDPSRPREYFSRETRQNFLFPSNNHPSYILISFRSFFWIIGNYEPSSRLFFISFVKVGKFSDILNRPCSKLTNQSRILVREEVQPELFKIFPSFYSSEYMVEKLKRGVTQIFVLILFNGGKFGSARMPRSRIYQHRGMYCVVRENVAVRNPYEFRNILLHYTLSPECYLNKFATQMRVEHTLNQNTYNLHQSI